MTGPGMDQISLGFIAITFSEPFAASVVVTAAAAVVDGLVRDLAEKNNFKNL